jgi:hypothetical protein
MPQVLPFTDDPAQSFTVALGGAKFLIEARYNDVAGFWTFDMTAEPSQVQLLAGVPILIGQDLLAPYALGIGGFFATDNVSGGVDAGPDDLGGRVTVTWLSPAELALIPPLEPIPYVPPSVVAPPVIVVPPWTPLSLGSTLKALYEGPGIIQAAGTATAWNDSSGNGSHLTAGVFGTYVANAGHGLPAVSFNGTSQYFTSSAFVTNRSFFAVVGGMNNPTGPACLCGAGRVYAQLGVANQMGVYVTPTFVTSGQTYNTARHSIAIIQRAANDIDFYLDGAKVNATTGTALFMDTQVSMGATETGGQFAVATMELMAICDAPLSNANVALMLGYMNRVYGV